MSRLRRGIVVQRTPVLLQGYLANMLPDSGIEGVFMVMVMTVGDTFVIMSQYYQSVEMGSVSYLQDFTIQ